MIAGTLVPGVRPERERAKHSSAARDRPIPDYADPSDFIDVALGPGYPGAGMPAAVRDPGTDEAIADAARLSGDARLNAYARLDRHLTADVLPALPFASGTITHFLSARMGCPVLHPIYGLDLAALCVREEDGE